MNSKSYATSRRKFLQAAASGLAVTPLMPGVVARAADGASGFATTFPDYAKGEVLRTHGQVKSEGRFAEAAREVPEIADVAITAHPGQRLVPLPEGSRYLGFLFSRAADPASAEAALRKAHARLEFRITPSS